MNKISSVEENLLLQYKRHDDGERIVKPRKTRADDVGVGSFDSNDSHINEIKHDMEQIKGLISNITSFLQVQKGVKKSAQKSNQEKYVYQTLQSNGEQLDSMAIDMKNDKGIPLVDSLTNQSSVSKTFPRIKAIQGQRRPSLSRFTSSYQPLHPSLAEDEKGAEIKPPYFVTPTQGGAPFTVAPLQQGGQLQTVVTTTRQEEAPISITHPQQGEIAHENFAHAAQVHNKSFDNESRDFSEMEYDSGTMERPSKGRRRRRKKKSSTTSNVYDQLN